MRSRIRNLPPMGAVLAGLLVMGLFLAGCQQGGDSAHDHEEGHESAEAQEEHPMTEPHPGVAEAVLAGEDVYYCPMHPEVISIEEGAKCQKCGDMVLVRHEGEVYNCPMHPEQVSADQAARCAECRMKLEQVQPLETGQSQTQGTTN